MFGDGSLTFREFMTREPHPLAMIQDAVLEFLKNRDDAALFGAQAVNAYVDEPRMTQDVDILSTRALELTGEIRVFLNQRFQIAVREREIRDGLGYRIYQIQKPKNRHLVDIRPVETFPPVQRIEDVLVVSPPELIANKLVAVVQRRGEPKSGTDWRDIGVLLLQFPELKTESGPVLDRLKAAGAGPDVLAEWKSWVDRTILPQRDEDHFDGA
jgi:hypothetical protein